MYLVINKTMYLVLKGSKSISILKKEGVSIHAVLKTENDAISEMKKANKTYPNSQCFVIPKEIAKELLIIN